MSLKFRLIGNQQVIHWLVLFSLLLGQFVLGFGYGIAAERNNDEIRIPVCTSTGIQYIIWTPDGIKQSTEPGNNTSSGNCTLCTVSPHQLRFDLQDSLLLEPLANDGSLVARASQLIGATFVLNPNAAPRAPPSV
ncbi:MAG: DUF2946 domain-containing protein [Burkholderiaceae bacterium]|nr:DUF2946 domain-containing protein [Burkholderiaceae bacterium]MCD8518164.1 DUF2946 domain-containing protein [Burkholderiaceae bacterium]MCD8537749.1 DUF2946 domain-containing protein [Burkholderiaceae bacterium]MCD8564168.1 DUF2946 domain-containing protein [Burkholderiaceae bacterium]